MANTRQIVIQMDGQGWKESLIGFFEAHPTLAKATKIIETACEIVDRKRYPEIYAHDLPSQHIIDASAHMHEEDDAILCVNDIDNNELIIATCSYIKTPADYYIDTTDDIYEAFHTLFPHVTFAVPV